MLKRNIKVTPAYDYPLNDQENAKHRRGCANIIFDITGDNGNVSFSVLTNWFLPETIEAIPDIATDYRGRSQTVYPRILTINSKKELKDMCEINARENRYCYTIDIAYEKKLNEILLREGSEVLFEELEKVYYKYMN